MLRRSSTTQAHALPDRAVQSSGMWRAKNLWRTVGQLLRLSLSLVAFALVWLGGLGEAAAAPIGMCSDMAESIAAPPPLYAASDAEMRACDPSPEDSVSNRDGAPSRTRILQPKTGADPFVVIEETFAMRPTRIVSNSTAPLSEPTTEEHRSSDERPPQG